MCKRVSTIANQPESPRLRVRVVVFLLALFLRLLGKEIALQV